MQDKIKRSTIYKLLSMCISYPEKIMEDALNTKWLFKNLKDNFYNDLDARKFIELMEEDFTTIEDLQIIYATNFDLKISLYESDYVIKKDNIEEKSNFLYNLEKFYIDSGVALSDRDMPDYLPIQLEFMHYLCSENLIDKQKFFLKNHLINWLPVLLNEVDKNKMKFYTHVIHLINYYINVDSNNIFQVI